VKVPLLRLAAAQLEKIPPLLSSSLIQEKELQLRSHDHHRPPTV